LATADAHGDDPVPDAASLHLVGQDADEAGTRHAEGVTD
jgi:hypothetical protein